MLSYQPDAFMKRMSQLGTKVLYDGLLVQQLHAARQGNYNGIRTWNSSGNSILRDVLEWYEQDLATTLVLVLSPKGVVLEPPTEFERRSPHKFFFDPPYW